MDNRVLISFVLLFLGFSFLFSISAVPTTRSLKSTEEEPAVQDLHIQDIMDMKVNGEMEEVMREGRIDIEITVDYPGTGANGHHDPKTPGRA